MFTAKVGPSYLSLSADFKSRACPSSGIERYTSFSDSNKGRYKFKRSEMTLHHDRNVALGYHFLAKYSLLFNCQDCVTVAPDGPDPSTFAVVEVHDETIKFPDLLNCRVLNSKTN